MPVLHRDYETRSALSLEKTGAHRYARDASADVWCIAYAVDDGPVQLWRPGDPVPQAWIAAARDPAWSVVAHNDGFETAIENHILGPRYGFPLVSIERHRCTMAAAQAAALPGALDTLAEILDLPLRKDRDGEKLMRLMALPRKPCPGEDPSKIYWHDDPEHIARLGSYAMLDVEIERLLFRRLPPLSPSEQEIWSHTALVNTRGFFVDRALARAGHKLALAEQTAVNAEIAELTGGTITSAHQTARIINFVRANGHQLKSLNKRSVSAVLAHKPDDDAGRVLKLRRDGAQASPRKFDSLFAGVDDDGRMRGTLRFHGAATGRWTGRRFQPQNLKRPETEDPDRAIDAVLAGDLERVRALGSPLAVVGDITRALICAAPGHTLIAGDFSAIESRVLAWLAGETWKVEAYRKFDETGDPSLEPYCVMASQALRRQVTPADEAGRQIGKTYDLSFGYGGGKGAWRRFDPSDTYSDTEIEKFKDTFRTNHRATVRLWYALEGGARRAVRTGQRIALAQKGLTFEFSEGNLYLVLPSGRRITYPEARLAPGKFGNEQVEFKDSAKGGWKDARAWHGIFAENAVSGICRDLLAAVLLRLEAAGYSIVLHVHDEAVAEVPEGFGSVAEFHALMTALPPWAEGLPIAAKVRSGPRYIKSSSKPAAVEESSPAEEAPPVEAQVEEPLPAAPPVEETPMDDQTSWRDYASGEREWGYTTDDYVYRDSAGMPYLKVTRTSAKQFPQWHWENGCWLKGKPSGPKIPYRLPELLAAPPNEPVWIAEGEKDADTITALGLIATTNSEGAGKWTADLNAWFVGKQIVYLLEDNDDAGRGHVIKISTALHGIVPTIRVISFLELPPGGDVSDWIAAGGTREQLFERAKTGKEPPKPGAWQFYNGADPAPTSWLIKGILPETGAGLISGQWGSYKTTVALDIAACVMTGISLADRFAVKRQGGVAYFAVEGSGGLASRLTAIARERDIAGALPFAFRSDCPALTAADALPKLVAMVAEASDRLEQDFGAKLALVFVDTIISAAAYSKAGDDNDATAADKVMATLGGLSQQTGALVLGVDHFGKVMENGTRGSSAKEGHADVVLALLADRELSGAVRNTRLALRKVREGANGLEMPFMPKIVEIGTDSDGDPITRVAIDWSPCPQAPERKWAKSLRLLQRILEQVLAETGREAWPFPSGPAVRACELATVRAEFYQRYVVDSATKKQQQDTRSKAFRRAVSEAQIAGLVEVRGELVWLTE